MGPWLRLSRQIDAVNVRVGRVVLRAEAVLPEAPFTNVMASQRLPAG